MHFGYFIVCKCSDWIWQEILFIQFSSFCTYARVVFYWVFSSRLMKNRNDWTNKHVCLVSAVITRPEKERIKMSFCFRTLQREKQEQSLFYFNVHNISLNHIFCQNEVGRLAAIQITIVTRQWRDLAKCFFFVQNKRVAWMHYINNTAWRIITRMRLNELIKLHE